MFKENRKGTSQTTDTLIGAGTEVEGVLKSQAGIRIEGQFSGEIDCDGDVVIGEKGTARSNIVARDVTVAGKIYGDVTTRGRLTIMPTGRLHGNASAAVLIVQEGGQLNGLSRMERKDRAEDQVVKTEEGAPAQKARQAG
jgi:cytoskeletal protein CcmA (bactofilin family)